MQAMRARALISGGLADTETDNLDLRKAIELSEASERDWKSFLAIDPSNTIAWNNLMASAGRTSGALWRAGRVDDSLAKGRQLLEWSRQRPMSAMIAGNLAAFTSAAIAGMLI